jgi:tetratricopeptide (TPR) repeat protein
LAQQVFERVLEREPRNTQSLSNLVRVLQVQGRVIEARAASDRLAQVERDPPFHFFDLGVAAMRSGDYRAARELFAKEIERDAYYHEFQFWLALAYFGLGDLPQARKHLDLAKQTSTTRKDHDLYAAKLDRIKSLRAQ